MTAPLIPQVKANRYLYGNLIFAVVFVVAALFIPATANAEFFKQRDKQFNMTGYAIGVHVLHAAGMTEKQSFFYRLPDEDALRMIVTEEAEE